MAENDDHEATYKEFREVVNTTESALEKHLKSEESQSVGQKKDYAHMRKVVGYVHGHLKQGGPKDKDLIEHLP